MSIKVDDILKKVQDAFKNRKQGTFPGTHAKGSGEEAIAGYFKNTHGIEIKVDNEALNKIASKDTKVTTENLKALLDSPEFKAAEHKAAEKQAAATKIQSAATKIQSVFRGNKGREEAVEQKKAEAEKAEAEKAAVETLIVEAYNASKGKGADEFVKELFGPEVLPSELVQKAKEIFEDINHYYRGSTIKDLNQIMSDKPDFRENLQDFAIKCVRILPNLFGAGIKTNAEVRSDFKIKEGAIDKKSFLEHAAKKDQNPLAK